MKSDIGKTVIQKLLNQAKKDNIQKIVAAGVIKIENKFLLLERVASDFMGGLVEFPSER